MRTTTLVMALGLLIGCKDKPKAASEAPVAKPTVAAPAAPPAPSLPEPAAPTAPADPRSVDELKTELAKTTSAIDAASALASDRSQPAEARAAAKTKLPALATEKRQLEALIKQKTEGEGAPKNLLGTGEGCTKDPASCN